MFLNKQLEMHLAASGSLQSKKISVKKKFDKIIHLFCSNHVIHAN